MAEGRSRRFFAKTSHLLAAVFGVLWMAASPAVAADATPATIPLIKLEYPGNPPNIRMLYIRLLALGDRRIDQPLLFDTGSAGVTVECSVVLPANLCSDSGIAITKTLELDGITVTTEKAVLNYGTYDEYGNIAVARVTLGSSDRPVSTTAAVPLLIRYKKVRRDTGQIVGGPLWPKGVFGVSPIGGGGPGQKLTSPLNAIAAGAGLRRGYYLSPIGPDWKICTNEEGNCPEVAALHIGISESVRNRFALSKWERADAHYNFPTINACIAWGDESVCRPTLYDTGNSTIMVAGKPRTKSETSLGVGVGVAVTAPNHAAWKFKTTYQPEVEFIPQLPHQIVGIRYFETNSLLFDLDAGEIGFRIGN